MITIFLLTSGPTVHDSIFLLTEYQVLSTVATIKILHILFIYEKKFLSLFSRKTEEILLQFKYEQSVKRYIVEHFTVCYIIMLRYLCSPFMRLFP